MTVALSMWHAAVGFFAWVGACVTAVAAGFLPIALYGRWLERHPRPPETTPMPAHYEQVRREHEAEQLAIAQVVAEAEDIVREAAP